MQRRYGSDDVCIHKLSDLCVVAPWLTCHLLSCEGGIAKLSCRWQCQIACGSCHVCVFQCVCVCMCAVRVRTCFGPRTTQDPRAGKHMSAARRGNWHACVWDPAPITLCAMPVPSALIFEANPDRCLNAEVLAGKFFLMEKLSGHEKERIRTKNK